MKYQYHKGDKIFFKVIVGASSVPLERDEVVRLADALKKGEDGLMFLHMGMVQLDKVIAIAPDFDRMEDHNVNKIQIEYPNIGAQLLKETETPQELSIPREGKVKSIGDITNKTQTKI